MKLSKAIASDLNLSNLRFLKLAFNALFVTRLVNSEPPGASRFFFMIGMIAAAGAWS
ncbi:MAG: hypothetical protein HHJ19_16985 [Polaromonas sp.]|nr:hypothetical protein [Polaromonas sp.]